MVAAAYDGCMYETFDHTADLGLRIRAKDQASLFAEAGRALTSCLVDDITTIQPLTTETIEVPGDDPVYLLFDWLRELLIRFETRKTMYAHFSVEISPTGLTAQASGEPLDRTRHPLAHEVKAITYHGLKCERDGDEWIAEVIVDI
jgi:SHS2 domain-containing protein